MVKNTPEQIAARREEIVNACEKLYQTMSFRDISLKVIGREVPFSRPTIYNYFQTKEEIFLALFEREYDRWNEELSDILDSGSISGRKELASKLAGSLSGRVQLLKLLSMNNYDMEASSRPELLVEFKKSYGRSIRLLGLILKKFCPGMPDADIQSFIYMFFPFMFGIYPYAEVTEKQRAAMTEAGVDYRYQSVYDLTYNFLIRLLGEKEDKE